MTRRGVMRLLTGLASAGLLTGCDIFGASFRVRVTVEVQTPQGLKTGSSVMEMSAGTRIAAGTQLTGRYTAGLSRGEAVVIELPGGPVFMLLKVPGDSFEGQIFDALNGDRKRLTNDDLMGFVRKMGGAWSSYRGEIPRNGWPLIVRFRDIADAKSVERVDPQAIGVTRIRLETTRDPVTRAIEKRLAWLRDGGLTLDPEAGPTTKPTFPQTVRQRAFSTEIER